VSRHVESEVDSTMGVQGLWGPSGGVGAQSPILNAGKRRAFLLKVWGKEHCEKEVPREVGGEKFSQERKPWGGVFWVPIFLVKKGILIREKEKGKDEFDYTWGGEGGEPGCPGRLKKKGMLPPGRNHFSWGTEMRRKRGKNYKRVF